MMIMHICWDIEEVTVTPVIQTGNCDQAVIFVLSVVFLQYFLWLCVWTDNAMETTKWEASSDQLATWKQASVYNIFSFF